MTQKPLEETFGGKLRYLRGRARNLKTGKPLSQKTLAEYLSARVGYQISRNKVNNWETSDAYLNSQLDRGMLVEIVAALYEHSGIATLDDANQLLESGKYQALVEAEKAKINPKWNSPAFRENAKSFAGGASGSDKPRNAHARSNPKHLFLAPPLPLQGVFGRKEELKRIFRLLEVDNQAEDNARSLSLRGMGGIGKTTLAIALAHIEEIKTTFEDGVLWTSLGPKPTIRLLLDGWGRALGIDLLPEHDESACQSRLRQELYDRCMLIIVDDVWDIIQGRYFQVGGPRCRTVFTTREVPIATALATRKRTLRVDVLKPEAALKLLYTLAPETAKVDKKIAAGLCARLEYLPLGLTLAGHMLANEADVPQRMQRLLGELIDRREARLQLLQEDGRKGLDEENPVSLQAILGMSVERLSISDQECFAKLSVFGGEPLTWEMNAVSAIWERPMDEAEAIISRMIQRGLVEPRGKRYWMHALLADYAEGMQKKMGL